MMTLVAMPQEIFDMGAPELFILLAVVLLLFGGSRLAGLGKSTGRALREFREETMGLTAEDHGQPTDRPQGKGASPQQPSSATRRPAQGDVGTDV